MEAKGAILMNTVLDTKKLKRPSKGKRTYVRRLKQDGRKENVSEADLKKKIRQIGIG